MPKSAKERVTSHPRNRLAPKMDGAQAGGRRPSLRFPRTNKQEGMGACDEAFGASPGETAPSADPGGSSKHSNENFED